MTRTRIPCIVQFTLILTLFAVTLATPEENMKKLVMAREATATAWIVLDHFSSLFLMCYESTMPHQLFLVDNLQTFVNNPAKTTVGVVPRFTSNRRFFANLITTLEFKAMVAEDTRALRRDLVKKMRFCADTVLDHDLLREVYEREVDQAKI